MFSYLQLYKAFVVKKFSRCRHSGRGGRYFRGEVSVQGFVFYLGRVWRANPEGTPIAKNRRRHLYHNTQESLSFTEADIY